MNTKESSPKPKNMSESPSFDSDGPWANAWCMHSYAFSSNGNQVQVDSRKSAESKTFSKRSAPGS